jgi:hypothetical protein
MNKHDIRLIIIVILLGISLMLFREITKKESNYAYVYYENKIIKEIDLRIDDTYNVTGYNGDIVIEVKDKKIRVKEENSPLHICSMQGWVSDNTPIVCLPNKVIIKMKI